MNKLLQPYSRRRMVQALLVSLLPTNALRLWGYRQLGYSFGAGTQIAHATLIGCASFAAGDNVTIGRCNRFIGPFDVAIGEGALIGRFNQFICGASAADPAKAHMGYARQLTIGAKALINDRHYFDVYGEISIGAGSWIAGIESQFWTHGASAMDRDIAIGENCYLGSAVRMAPGTAIGDRCVLGIGSVVVSRLVDSDAVLAGFPAKRLRSITLGDDRQFSFTME